MVSATTNGIKQRQDNQPPILLTLILQGCTEQVLKNLADNPFDINALLKTEEKLELTPFELALNRGYTELAKKLTELTGFDLDKSGHNPLRLAINLGYKDIAIRLLKLGANPNYYQKGLENCLQLSLENGFF